jgi:SAM-dependent methyltransferase
MSPYEADLAFIHDEGFTQLAESGAGLALELLAGTPAGPVFEVGCGGGVTAARLLAAGRPVVGIDISAAQVDLARRRAPAAELSAASYVDAELPDGLAAVVAFGEIFNYAFDERAGPGALAGFAVRAFAALMPGGLMLFDCAGPGRVPGGGPARSFEQGESWAVLHESRETVSPPEVRREITSFRLIDGGWRRSAESHPLQLHEPASVLAALGRAGFETEVRESYAERLSFPGLQVFIGRKPGPLDGPS